MMVNVDKIEKKKKLNETCSDVAKRISSKS